MKNFRQYISEEEKKYKPNAGMAAAAKKAIKWKDEHGDEVDAGTRTGWVRASQLADREEVSLDIVKRMHSFFSRHEGNQTISPENKETPWKDNGYVAWLIWGGDAGKEWAESIVKSLEESEYSLQEAALGKFYYHVTLQKHVLKIIKQGIKPLMPSNWVRADGTRYNKDGGIFAFEHPEDAARWAFNMSWETKKKVAIVRIKKTGGWEKDPSEDINLQMGKGKALKRYDSIKASDIVDAIPVDTKSKDYFKVHIKALLEPVVRPQDMDWHDNFLNINRKIMSEDEII